MKTEVRNDKKYWDSYYANVEMTKQPTRFAQMVYEYKDHEHSRLLEIGCGNGRDAVFFHSKGIDVVAMDASTVAIEKIQEEHKGIDAINCDFVKGVANYKDHFTTLYSRFTIHSINDEQQEELLANAYEALVDGGKLFIEVRGIRDDIYGLGEEVGRHAFIYNDHYRRFVVLEEIEEQLKEIGFEILMAVEEKDFAPYKDTNPYIIRIIAKK